MPTVTIKPLVVKDNIVPHVLIFSDNKAFIKSCLTALHSNFKVDCIDTLENNINAAAIIIDALQIDKNQHILSFFNKKTIRYLIIGNNWPENNQINALVHGAAGYCNINESSALINQAIISILKGDLWIQRHLVPSVIGTLVEIKQLPSKQVIHDKQSTAVQLIKSLSNREQDVANMIRLGESNKIIALKLNISERTVKAHLTSIFKKTNIKDRLHLALFLKEFN